MKKCNRCGLDAPQAEFLRDVRYRDGYSTYCRHCRNEKSNEWARANPEKRQRFERGRLERINADPALLERRHEQRRYQKYGITENEFEAMYEAQGGVCVICGRPERRTYKGTVRALCVEHNHETGQVRGLACADCNTAIALMGDEPRRLRSAADYLEQHANGNLTNPAVA